MAEIGYAVAICCFWGESRFGSSFGSGFGEDNSVDRGDEEVVGPVGEEVAYVYEDWGRGVRFGWGWLDGDWSPFWLR